MARKILIVDDDPVAVELMEYVLRAEGYETQVVATGADGIAQADLYKPDIILLDVMLPQMDGFEVCRRLKSQPETRDIAIIMLSARAQRSDLEKGRQLGADLYLTKPIDLTALAAQITEFLDRSSAGL